MSLSSELRKLKELSLLGDQTSAAKIKLLFDFHKGTLEAQAWKLWLERVYPDTSWASDYQIGIHGGKFRVIPLKSEEKSIEVILVEDENETYLRLGLEEATPPVDPRDFLGSDLWTTIGPWSSYCFLDSLGSLRLPPLFVSEGLILEGTKALSESLGSKLREVLKKSTLWSLPDLQSRNFRRDLTRFQDSFPKWVRLHQLKESRGPVFDLCDRIYQRTVQIGKLLYGSLKEEFFPEEIISKKFPTAREDQRKYRFRLSPLSRESKLSLEVHPVIQLLSEVKLGGTAENPILEIKSSNPGLVCDLIKPLHSSYMVESIS